MLKECVNFTEIIIVYDIIRLLVVMHHVLVAFLLLYLVEVELVYLLYIQLGSVVQWFPTWGSGQPKGRKINLEFVR